MVKSTCCPCRVPGFGSQHPHGCSQPSVIIIPEQKCLLLASTDSSTHRVHTNSWEHTLIHIKINTILSVFYWYIITLKYLSRCISFVKFLDLGFFLRFIFVILIICLCRSVHECGLQIASSWNYV